MNEALLAELRALAHADRRQAWKHRRNVEELAKHLAEEGRKIADRDGLAVGAVELEFYARQIARCAVKPGAETSRLTARRRKKAAAS
jgi:hypothetical protein